MKDSSFYDIPAGEEDANGEVVPNENGNEVNGSIGMNYSYSMDCKDDYEFAQKRWKELYDIGEAVRLQDAVKMHLYKKNFEVNNDLSDGMEIDPNFDPLKC
jgi:hypothetical protein